METKDLVYTPMHTEFEEAIHPCTQNLKKLYSAIQ